MTNSAIEQVTFEWWNWMEIASELTNPDFFKTRSSRLDVKYRPKVASMFAGCGGMDLGLSWSGFNTVYANEIDHQASSTFSTNLGLSVDTKSIEDVDIASIPDHDLLVGGFPCQPFSYAGLRKGLRDPRGMLFYGLMDILVIKKPGFFIFENVKGLLTHDKGRTFQNVSNAILDAGYRFSYSIIKKGFWHPLLKMPITYNRNICMILHKLYGKQKYLNVTDPQAAEDFTKQTKYVISK